MRLFPVADERWKQIGFKGLKKNDPFMRGQAGKTRTRLSQKFSGRREIPDPISIRQRMLHFRRTVTDYNTGSQIFEKFATIADDSIPQNFIKDFQDSAFKRGAEVVTQKNRHCFSRQDLTNPICK